MSRSIFSGLAGPGLLVIGAVSAAAPASAQFYGGYPPAYPYNVPPGSYRDGGPYQGSGPYGEPAPRRIPAGRIVDRLEDQGYEDLSRPHFTGTTYVIDASPPGGGRVRLVIDAIRGIVLNQVVLGAPRGYASRDSDDDEAPEPRYRGRPGMPYPGPDAASPPGRLGGPGPTERDRRTARNPDPGAAVEQGLAPPADPRLAPSSRDRTGQPVEGRADPQDPLRSNPESRPTPPRGSPVQGINPDGSSTGRKPAQQQARRPSGTSPSADETRTPGEAKPGTSTAKPKPTVDAKSRQERPVRVIEGVTPMAASPRPETQLDNLPAPPPTPPVTTE